MKNKPDVFEPIIVVGPGRCGTSAVAGVLHHLGVFMGEQFVPAHRSNPYGHWEDVEFLNLNIGLLRSNLTEAHWRSEVSALIEKRCELGLPWGWKDPRTCELLPLYLGLLRRPRFVRCHRRPECIDTSIMMAYGRYGWTWKQARALRQSREQYLDRYLRGHRILDIDFEHLKQDPRKAVGALVDFAGLAGVGKQVFQHAVKFIRP